MFKASNPYEDKSVGKKIADILEDK
jgi:hypothetical protein